MAQHDLITAQHATQAKLDALLAQQTHAKKAKQNVVVPNFIKVICDVFENHFIDRKFV